SLPTNNNGPSYSCDYRVFTSDGFVGFISAPHIEVTYRNTAGGGSQNGPGQPPTQPGVEDPVNVVTGSLVDTFVDVPSPTGAAGLEFTRTYNSVSSVKDAFGLGWTHAYGQRLVTDADGGRTLWDADGRRIRFGPNGAGGFLRPVEYP